MADELITKEEVVEGLRHLEAAEDSPEMWEC